MKLSLKVTTGKQKGKIIPVTSDQFVIGRDPQCHLRPASLRISNRHCAIVRHQNKTFLHDLGTIDGTLVNGQPVKGKIELKNADRVKVGPIEFEVHLEAATAPAAKGNEPAPLPATQSPPAGDVAPEASGATDDESVAELLMSLMDDGSSPTSSGLADRIPEGGIGMEVPPMPPDERNKKQEKPKTPSESTSFAASMLLDKMKQSWGKGS
jgi:predicted component of type VI protein secretion system